MFLRLSLRNLTVLICHLLFDFGRGRKMTFVKKFLQFCNENVVLISGVSIIVGFHWAWWRLQKIPALVDPEERKELPIFIGLKSIKQLAENKYHELRDPGSKQQ